MVTVFYHQISAVLYVWPGGSVVGSVVDHRSHDLKVSGSGLVDIDSSWAV